MPTPKPPEKFAVSEPSVRSCDHADRPPMARMTTSAFRAAAFTTFPTSIGLAATWDPAATEEMADIIRRQMRAVGMHQALV